MNETVAVTVILTFAQLVQAGLNIFFFSHVLSPKYSWMKIVCGMMALQGVYLCSAQALNLNGLIRWMGAVMLQLAIAKLFFRNSWKVSIFSVGVQYILAFTGEFATELFIRILYPGQQGLPTPIMQAVGNAFFCLPYGLCIFLFCQFWKRNSSEISEKNIYATLAFPVLPFFLLSAAAYFLLVCLSRWNNVLIPAMNVVAGAFLCLGAAAIMFRMFSEMAKKDQLADQLKLLERQSRLELAYYTALDEKTREVRKIRHDFNNQLQTAYSVFAQGRPEEAQKHLQQLERRIEEASPVYFCGNPILNALLWDKQKEAKARQVAFQADVRLPEETGIEQIDLCSVFSNLLDNAAEAAASCEKGGVSVQAYEQSGYCVVRVENTIPAETAPERKEKRTARGEGHGYGIPILKSICRKYGGTFRVKREAGKYQTVVTLKLGQEERP